MGLYSSHMTMAGAYKPVTGEKQIVWKLRYNSYEDTIAMIMKKGEKMRHASCLPSHKIVGEAFYSLYRIEWKIKGLERRRRTGGYFSII